MCSNNPDTNCAPFWALSPSQCCCNHSHTVCTVVVYC